MYYCHMKFERWNKKTNEFELVKMTSDEFEELLKGFAIMEAEVEIEDRIQLLKSFDKGILKEIGEKCKYD